MAPITGYEVSPFFHVVADADNGADDDNEDYDCFSGCGRGEGEIHSLQTQALCTRLGEIFVNQIMIIFSAFFILFIICITFILVFFLILNPYGVGDND